jgi:hypothetical protein
MLLIHYLSKRLFSFLCLSTICLVMPLIRYLSDRLFRFLMPEQNLLGDAD